jgi:23S rRNA (guanosine2251-2'-O)-methyltransferase
VPKKFIENKLKNNISHQGIMLLVKPYPYFDKEKIFHKKCKLCIIINNIKDPINFGKIIRLSLAFSVDFIAITKNKSTQISQIVEKTSSGAAAIVPIIQIGNFIQFLNFLKKEEYSIIGISNGNYTSLWKYSFSKKIAIILGSEECGINNTIKKKCSKIINIPINKSLNSINISNAAGIILYEINKQIFN